MKAAQEIRIRDARLQLPFQARVEMLNAGQLQHARRRVHLQGYAARA